jgi:flagellar basal body P-ring formation protein FlgA
MNSRSLSPFLVSVLVLGAAASPVKGEASSTSALSGFTQPLSSLRHASVDAHGQAASTESSIAAYTSQAAVPEAQMTGNAKPSAETYTLSREQLLDSVRDQVLAHFNLVGDLQLELLRSWSSPAVSADPVVLEVVEFPAQMSANILVKVRYASGEKALGESMLSLRAQLWRDAFVTREPVARESVFDPASLDTRRVDALREKDFLPADLADKSYAFSRTVPAGRILCWRDIARRALVRKGDVVDVTAVDGMLSITMKAVALQNGAAGDTISVRNIESKKDIAVQVVAANRVQVRF